MNDLQKFETIERYLRHQMPTEEAKEFEQQLENDSELKTEVEAFKTTYTGLNALEFENFNHQLTSWFDEHKKNNPESLNGASENENKSDPKIDRNMRATSGYTEEVTMRKRGRARSFFSKIAAAASVIVLLGAFSLWYSGNNYSNPAIVGKYYQYEPGSFRAESADNAINKGITAMQSSQYDQAIAAFKSIPNEDKAYDKATFLLANCQLSNENFDDASATFRSVIGEGNPLYREKA